MQNTIIRAFSAASKRLKAETFRLEVLTISAPAAIMQARREMMFKALIKLSRI